VRVLGEAVEAEELALFTVLLGTDVDGYAAVVEVAGLTALIAVRVFQAGRCDDGVVQQAELDSEPDGTGVEPGGVRFHRRDGHDAVARDVRAHEHSRGEAG
jgi:hypothetical protein